MYKFMRMFLNIESYRKGIVVKAIHLQIQTEAFLKTGMYQGSFQYFDNRTQRFLLHLAITKAYWPMMMSNITSNNKREVGCQFWLKMTLGRVKTLSYDVKKSFVREQLLNLDSLKDKLEQVSLQVNCLFPRFARLQEILVCAGWESEMLRYKVTGKIEIW